MTWISANNKHLNLGISLKFDLLQNVPLTQSRCHDDFSLKILLMSNPTPNTFSQLLIGCQDAAALLSDYLIGHQDTWLIIISHC